ncbi:hypothetical protein [Paenibacillus sp. FSL E2-0178]
MLIIQLFPGKSSSVHKQVEKIQLFPAAGASQRRASFLHRFFGVIR